MMLIAPGQNEQCVSTSERILRIFFKQAFDWLGLGSNKDMR